MSHINPIAFFDAPFVLDSSVTPIPGSGFPPLQVIQNLGQSAAFAIDYIDETNEYIGVYIGPPNQEILKMIIGGGITARAWCVLAAHSRVSLRSMSASPITVGKLMCVFLGY